MAGKYPGLTALYSPRRRSEGGGSGRPSGRTLVTQLEPLIGRGVATPADLTPGRALARSRSVL
jgi:hypothetical protein